MSKLTAPGAFGGQTLKTYVSVYEKDFAESQAESPAVKPSGAEAHTEAAARDKRKREDEPKVKTVSTGKTDAMLAECGSPEINFFGKKRLKQIYPPDSGSSAYTEDSPVPNLHHPDFIKKDEKPLPSPAPSMHMAVFSDGDSPASSSAGSSAGSAEVM
jgi:hypothetical protein